MRQQMHVEGRALFSTAATAAALALPGFLRRLPGNDFVSHQIAQPGKVAGYAKPHVRFGVLKVLRDESVVVMRERREGWAGHAGMVSLTCEHYGPKLSCRRMNHRPTGGSRTSSGRR